MARPYSVWIVDDDPELRSMLSDYLRQHGHAVRSFESAEQFRLHLQVQRPDLAVLDLMPITSGEFTLLMAFVQNPNRPLSRLRLIELARGMASDTDQRSMDVQVSRLRKLIETDPKRPRYLQTVWGTGYVFVPEGTFSE